MIKAYAAMKAGANLQPFEYEPGPLDPNEVEISVESCGICHSDLSMIDNAWGISEYPLIPGHEIIGRIKKLGENVKNLAVGQLVGLGWHAGYCMHCMNCMQGDHNLCQDATGTIVAHNGGFAEAVRAKGASVIPLPKGIDSKSAGPLFCGGITVFNPMVQFNLSPTAKVGVIGIGGLGHLALQFLNAWGCEVWAFTSSEEKLEEAKKLGAHHTIDSRAKKKGCGFDFILSTVNVNLDFGSYLEALKPKGRLHFVGAALDPLDIEAFSLISNQRSCSGSPVGSPATIVKMVDFAARHDIQPVTETFNFSEVNEALDHLRSGKARYRIVLKH